MAFFVVRDSGEDYRAQARRERVDNGITAEYNFIRTDSLYCCFDLMWYHKRPGAKVKVRKLPNQVISTIGMVTDYHGHARERTGDKVDGFAAPP